MSVKYITRKNLACTDWKILEVQYHNFLRRGQTDTKNNNKKKRGIRLGDC